MILKSGNQIPFILSINFLNASEEIDFILAHRVAKAEGLCKTYPWYEALNDQRKLVVIDMVYNLGNTKFSQFHGTHHSIAIGDYAAASQGMLNSLWAKQVGKRATRLARIMESGTWEV